MLKFIVDTMGGDLGSQAVVQAIKEFIAENDDVKIVAVGKKEELASLEGLSQVEIRDARDVVKMDAGALEVLRMKDSSMVVALNVYKEEGGDGIISCGSTGAFLSACTVKLKMIPGIKRAALCVSLPTIDPNKHVAVLDVGANNENSPEELVQFAVMGRLYAQAVYGLETPRVATMANGTEDGKGSPAGKIAHKMLKDMNFPGYVGNMEARNVLYAENDVVVFDGYSGNVFIKCLEGTAKAMGQMMKDMFVKNLWTKLGYLHVKKGMKELRTRMNYKSTGGALLLGINGICIKAHGNADAYCFKNAIYVAKNLSKYNLIERIKEGLPKE